MTTPAPSNQRVTHGHARRSGWSREFQAWVNMRKRCRSADRYVERGIKVCERWNSFENFLADMGECPPGLTIERVDNDKGYEPGNCVWATRTVQNRNTGRSRVLTVNDDTRTVAEWAELQHINPKTIIKRLQMGWTPAESVLTQVGEPR